MSTTSPEASAGTKSATTSTDPGSRTPRTWCGDASTATADAKTNATSATRKQTSIGQPRRASDMTGLPASVLTALDLGALGHAAPALPGHAEHPGPVADRCG